MQDIFNNHWVLTLTSTVVIYLIKSFILFLLHKKISVPQTFYKVKRGVNSVAFFLLIIILIGVWSDSASQLLTFFGIFSAGLALALKDILMNISGWAYILIRQPFSVGDRIEIDGVKGDVIDQNIFKFRVVEIGNWVHAEQSTGRVVHIPNYKIFTESMANYTIGFKYIWEELRVQITFESDWRKAKQILQNIVDDYCEDIEEVVQKQLKALSKKYMIYYNNVTPIVYTDVSDSGVVLTIRYLCEPKKRRTSNEALWERILESFHDESTIEIAYPTIRRV